MVGNHTEELEVVETEQNGGVESSVVDNLDHDLAVSGGESHMNCLHREHREGTAGEANVGVPVSRASAHLDAKLVGGRVREQGNGGVAGVRRAPDR